MISKKFLGIFGILVLMLISIQLISAPCTCNNNCVITSNNCGGVCGTAEIQACEPGFFCSCMCSPTFADCSTSCSSTLDQCPSPTTRYIYTDYDQNAYNSAQCGADFVCHVFSGCPVIKTGYCNVTNECATPEYCGSTPLKCVFSQSKLASPHYGWTSTSTNNEDPSGISALDCSDGHDNDCDGLVDCAEPACASVPYCQSAPTSPKLIIKNSGGNVAAIGSNGAMDIKLTNFSSQSTITSTTNDFLIRNSAGTILAMITNSGNLYLRGQIYQNQASLNSYLTNGQNDFIVRNSTGSVVAVFDSSGNLRLAKSFRTSQNP